ncbi:Gp49 family protein [Aggregatibacter actinomycetemcomitans]|uniref:Gp49 family protein n=1 Tax=Aggregatibacter actinomycetemcomitans TaxID=714 RepID=UPI00022BFDA3
MYQPFSHLTPRGKPYDLPPIIEPHTKQGNTMEKLTYEHIKSVIKSVEYVHVGVLTICVLTLQNGFTVTGESACLSLATYDTEIGRKIARDNAEDKIWMLEGYLAKQRMFEATQSK